MSPDQASMGHHPARQRLSLRPPLSVLFVDPDVRRAQQLARSLPTSALVAFAQSAGAALQVISLRRPDLIVTELDLPDLFGVDLIARLQNTPATHHVLVMVVTARSAVRDKIAALRAGADDYVVAPVAPDTFALRVQLLSRFRPHPGL